MAKELTISIIEEQELNGVTALVTTHTIVRATPNSGNLPTYVRLHDLENDLSYLWSGDPYEVDENTEPTDPKWVLEQ